MHRASTGTRTTANADASPMNALPALSGMMNFATASAPNPLELAIPTSTGTTRAVNVFASHLQLMHAPVKPSQATGTLELASASALNQLVRLVSTSTMRLANAHACHKSALMATTGTLRPAAVTAAQKIAQLTTTGIHLHASADASDARR